MLLFVGYRAIRTKRIALHRFAMQGAFVTSTIFLVCYLTRFYLTGTHRFPGTGGSRSSTSPFFFRTWCSRSSRCRSSSHALPARASRFLEHRKIAKYHVSRVDVRIRHWRDRVRDALPRGLTVLRDASRQADDHSEKVIGFAISRPFPCELSEPEPRSGGASGGIRLPFSRRRCFR